MDYSKTLNQKVFALHKSSTLKITSLAKKLKQEGEDVIIFAAGEPDFDTPSFVKDAAKSALDAGMTKYTPSSGLIELRQAISKKFKTENDILYQPDQILVTAGAKYALYLSLLTLIDSLQDEVIIPAPFWVSYPEMVTLAGGTVKVLATERKDEFKITPELLKKNLGPKSKVLVLNYPSNPTGVTYSPAELKDLWKVIREYSLYVLSDEIYEKIIFDGRAHASFASLAGAYDRTLTVNGFSKSFSMTGWRLGYVAGPKEIIEQTAKILDHTTSCTTTFAQKGAIAALEQGKEWSARACREFEARRDLICEQLSSCTEIEVVRPQGTFYLFCDISKTGLSSMEFASRLLESFRVAVIPSEGFGLEGYIRISFATDRETIKRGIDRIKKFVNSL